VELVLGFFEKHMFHLVFFVTPNAAAAEQGRAQIFGVVFEIFSLLEVVDQKLSRRLVSWKLLVVLRLLFHAWVFVDGVEFFHHSLVSLSVCDVAHNLV